jgi:hypothetical protein
MLFLNDILELNVICIKWWYFGSMSDAKLRWALILSVHVMWDDIWIFVFLWQKKKSKNTSKTGQ